MHSHYFMNQLLIGMGAPSSRTLSARFGCVMGLFLSIYCATASAQSQQSAAPPAMQTAPQISAQSGARGSPTAHAQADLSQISIEDLMNIKVTSVSKTEQKMSRAAAAIFVITQEDIHHSGATNIPDLLRMVPGLDVSQINANAWSVSSRGFNQQFTNKLLVLIDGRAVYSPLLGGVNWDTQDVPLDDIDRIEVIRGPGATIWGANAVNGVINIVTKSASETQGGLITAGGGTEGKAQATAQYGGTIHGATSYRIFAKYLNQGSLPELDGESGDDAWHLLHGGFRADTKISTKDSLTVQGDLYTGAEGADDHPYFLGRSACDRQLGRDYQPFRRQYSRPVEPYFFEPFRHHLCNFILTTTSETARNPRGTATRLISTSIITLSGDRGRTSSGAPDIAAPGIRTRHDRSGISIRPIRALPTLQFFCAGHDRAGSRPAVPDGRNQGGKQLFHRLRVGAERATGVDSHELDDVLVRGFPRRAHARPQRRSTRSGSGGISRSRGSSTPVEVSFVRQPANSARARPGLRSGIPRAAQQAAFPSMCPHFSIATTIWNLWSPGRNF